MRATDRTSRPTLRRLPPEARTAMAEKLAARSGHDARSQFSRTFEDVLSVRFGGRWSVEWESANHAPLAADGDRRSFSREE